MGLNTPGHHLTLEDMGDRAGKVVIHWNPYIHVPGSSNAGDTLRKAFWTLVRQVAEWRPDLPRDYATTAPPVIVPRRRHDRDYDGRSTILMDPTTREGLQRLYDAILDAIDASYAAGKQDGRSLLVGLAQGEIAPADFEKRIGG